MPTPDLTAYTGAAIYVPESGNIINQTVGYVPA